MRVCMYMCVYCNNEFACVFLRECGCACNERARGGGGGRLATPLAHGPEHEQIWQKSGERDNEV